MLLLVSPAFAGADRYKLNPFTGRFDNTGPYNGELDSAPTSKDDSYMAVVDDVLWYFAGGNRYKIVATLDNPAGPEFRPCAPGMAKGLLLAITCSNF